MQPENFEERKELLLRVAVSGAITIVLILLAWLLLREHADNTRQAIDAARNSHR